MYKAGQYAVSRTVLPSLQQKQRVYGNSVHNCASASTSWRTDEEQSLLKLIQSTESVESEVPLTMFTRSKGSGVSSPRPPSTPSSPSPLIEQQIEFLDNAWRAWRETESGEDDPRVIRYMAKGRIPENFEPFNVDRFLAEKLLKELDIDPKIALF